MQVFNKFTLRTFNRLVYNQEISGFFVASSLLGLPKYYIILYNVKSINIKLFRGCFYKFTLGKYNKIKDKDNFIIL